MFNLRVHLPENVYWHSKVYAGCHVTRYRPITYVACCNNKMQIMQPNNSKRRHNDECYWLIDQHAWSSNMGKSTERKVLLRIDCNLLIVSFAIDPTSFSFRILYLESRVKNYFMIYRKFLKLRNQAGINAVFKTAFQVTSAPAKLNEIGNYIWNGTRWGDHRWSMSWNW